MRLRIVKNKITANYMEKKNLGFFSNNHHHTSFLISTDDLDARTIASAWSFASKELGDLVWLHSVMDSKKFEEILHPNPAAKLNLLDLSAGQLSEARCNQCKNG